AIQETFDAFFNPVKDPLKELNTAKSEENVKNVLQLIKLPEWLDLPEGFESLQPEEQEVVAYIVMSFASSDYDYKSKEEVQFAIEVGYEGLMAMLQTDPLLFQQHLNSFYSLISQTSEHMSYPGADLLQFVGQKYSKLSLVDKQLVSYIAQRISKDESLSMNDKYTIFLLLLMQYSSINEPATTGEMLAALNSIYVYQHSSEANTPDKKFPLDFGKLATITSNETKQEQLAQWMIAKKPVGGYTSYEEIQKAFNAFFAPPSDPTTPGSSTGSGSGGGGSSTPVATTKQEQIVVDVNGVNGTNLTKTPITRTTETNGVVKDLVKMTDTIAKQSVEKAKQLGTDTARIVIPDTKDAVSETRIEVPKTAVKELSDGSLKLEISTANAVISVPTKSIAGFDQDLYFRIVPLKKDSERNEVEERAKKEQVIQKAAPNSNVRVLARPVEIETNMQSREITLTLPLGNSLPTEATARQQALNKLAVYIEHSDGTKELVRGKLVKLTDGSEGIEFTVTKFSTFTLVSVDGLKATQQANPPYIQGFGTDFRPDAFVTRAQMAAMLARNLSGEAAMASTTAVSFADVAATHWAANEIEQARAAGIMNGLNSTVFAPEGSITRAQMATIAYRWMQQQANAEVTTGTASNVDATSTTTATGPATNATAAASFNDVPADLWAADAIAYVQSAGLMTGYQDGTFKPEGRLTRAEAVKVLNVLFKRTPLTGAGAPSFSDVPATHWAYADIEAAAQK
ncbi:S-layer family protein, partial [Paenibacillus barcinonensis]